MLWSFQHLQASHLAWYSLSCFKRMRNSNGIRGSNTYLMNTISSWPSSGWPRVWWRNPNFPVEIIGRDEWWKTCTFPGRARLYLTFSDIDDVVSWKLKPQFSPAVVSHPKLKLLGIQFCFHRKMHPYGVSWVSPILRLIYQGICSK